MTPMIRKRGEDRLRQALTLRATAHVKACTCCSDDLDLVEEEPHTYCALKILERVETAVRLAAYGSGAAK